MLKPIIIKGQNFKMTKRKAVYYQVLTRKQKYRKDHVLLIKSSESYFLFYSTPYTILENQYYTVWPN